MNRWAGRRQRPKGEQGQDGTHEAEQPSEDECPLGGPEIRAANRGAGDERGPYRDESQRRPPQIAAELDSSASAPTVIARRLALASITTANTDHATAATAQTSPRLGSLGTGLRRGGAASLDHHVPGGARPRTPPHPPPRGHHVAMMREQGLYDHRGLAELHEQRVREQTGERVGPPFALRSGTDVARNAGSNLVDTRCRGQRG